MPATLKNCPQDLLIDIEKLRRIGNCRGLNSNGMSGRMVDIRIMNAPSHLPQAVERATLVT